MQRPSALYNFNNFCIL